MDKKLVPIDHPLFTKNHTEVLCEDVGLWSYNYNAPHAFQVRTVKGENVLCNVNFQCGPIKEYGVNGVNNEDLLLMVLTRLEAFQKTKYACEENTEAIEHLVSAVRALRKRADRRKSEGTLNTSKV